jgi:opacity protein-like surface antigen
MDKKMTRISGKKFCPLEGLRHCCLLLLAVALAVPSVSFAIHPLITDDAGTVGKGQTQIEMNGEVASDKEADQDVETEEIGTQLSTVLTYGISDTIDIVVGVPYLWSRTRENGDTVHNDRGFSDVSIEMKWRFYEHDGLSLALKPGLTLPTGNYRKSLGSGRHTYGLAFIVTKGMEPFTFHVNAGYRRNENKVDERKDIWAASIAGEFKLSEALTLVGNAGLERNADFASNTPPAFALAGVIYNVTENVALDAGFKVGLDKAETDHAILAGITVKF